MLIFPPFAPHRSAHSTFWDFVVSNPETAHHVLWQMSDRGIPRSYRTMEGFGINTFRLVNAAGVSRLCKFHLKPSLGVHSLTWEEAQSLSGCDPDFLRRDLWDAIASGEFPEYTLGVQLLDDAAEAKYFDVFDPLDPTTLWPEELVPVTSLGKLVLDRNPTEFFAETEQVAFCPANLVPGIDVSEDPILQGRLFSYLDTQISRLGGPNFHEIPINKSLGMVHNNQRGGFHRDTIGRGRVAYSRNSLRNDLPAAAPAGFVSAPVELHGPKVRQEPASFSGRTFAQAALFWASLSAVERAHVLSAFAYELGLVPERQLRERVAQLFAGVDAGLGRAIALGAGVQSLAIAAGESAAAAALAPSPALSMHTTNNLAKGGIRTMKVGVLVPASFPEAHLKTLTAAIACRGATAVPVGVVEGAVEPAGGGAAVLPLRSLLTTPAAAFDAVVVLSPEYGTKLPPFPLARARAFVRDAFEQCKTLASAGAWALTLLRGTAPEIASLLDCGTSASDRAGVIAALCETSDDVDSWCDRVVAGLAVKRHWARELSSATEAPCAEV
eukprot:TRINITY_DN3135_c0_g1_i2.p1 TRINITY_DN3135_c0_g1~~TRINITY_DN3135_c0_g1_i2.p1  ORF type:complete len:554 (+),score=150.13 TRINITY_DN3135_c0_g1_i2:145-1806(+)